MKSGHFKDYNKIDYLNSDFKTEDFKLSLELADLRKEIDYVRRDNHELKNTMNEMKVLMKSGQFSDNNKADARIKTERKPVPIQVAKKGQKENRIRSAQRISKFLSHIICLEMKGFHFSWSNN